MAEQAPRTRQAFEAQVIDRAWKDAAFRRALTEDPRATLERELGVRVPAGVTLTVVEETRSSRYLVLPPAPTGEGGGLSDAELEAVAGGDPGESQSLISRCGFYGGYLGCP
jgi:Nitrile hydratase, alpha chain